MKVTLEHYTPLIICSKATRTCYDSHAKSDNGGEKDQDLIYRVGKKNRHSSVLEHINFSFYVEGISRACLQEVARHRLASLSVKSTRYTLNELRKEEKFSLTDADSYYRAHKYLVFTGDTYTDDRNILSLNSLISELNDPSRTPIDILKYSLPEAYKTNLMWTINLRSLMNFIELRTSKRALHEIRVLAFKVLETIPDEFKRFFEDFSENSSENS